MASASSGCGAGLLRFLRLVGQLKVSKWSQPGREAARTSSGSDLTRPPSLSREGASGDPADAEPRTRARSRPGSATAQAVDAAASLQRKAGVGSLRVSSGDLPLSP